MDFFRSTNKEGLGAWQSQDSFGNGLGRVPRGAGGLTVLVDVPEAEQTGFVSIPIFQIPVSYTATLTAFVTNNVGPVLYQWYKNGVAIPGATGATYVALTGTLDSSTYKVAAEDATGPKGYAKVILQVVPLVINGYSIQGAYLELSSFTLSVFATGLAMTYQWFKDGLPISGATGSTYTVNPAQLANTGIYSVVVTNVYGDVTVDNQFVVVIPSGEAILPTIVIALEGPAAVKAGTTLRFTSTPAGTGPFTLQWQYEDPADLGVWVNLATTPFLTIDSSVAADTGTYRCLVSSPLATDVASNSIGVSVADAPVITSQPSGITGYKGLVYSLSVSALGNTPFSYQWEKQIAMVWTAIVGATSQSLSFPDLQAVDAGSYHVVVSNGTSPDATSDTAVVTVGNIAITANGGGAKSVAAGNSLSLQTTTLGAAPITYGWEKWNGASWDPIAGTTGTISLTNAQFSDAGDYRCTATNAYGSASVTFTVTVTGGSVSISRDSTGLYGSSRLLTAVVVASLPVTYQWLKNNVPIPGATSSTYLVPSVVPADDGAVYKVEVTNSYGTFSGTATVPASAVLFGSPSAVSAPAASSPVLSAPYTANGTLSFQWYKNGVAIPGATGATLTLVGVLPADAGSYFLEVTNSYGTGTSPAVVLTITNITITVQPVDTTLFQGSSGGLLVAASGPGVLTYQWFKDAVLIPGATSAAYTFTNFSSAQTGNYYCVVTNSYGSLQSYTAIVALGSVNTSLEDYTQVAVGAFISPSITIATPAAAVIGTIIYLNNDGGAGFYLVTNLVGSLATLQRTTAPSGGQFLPVIAAGILVHGSSVLAVGMPSVEILVTELPEVEVGYPSVEILVIE